MDVSGHPHSCESSFLVHPVSCVPCPACCAHRQRKRRLPKPTRQLPAPTKGPPTPQERAADYALPLKRQESCGLNEQRKTTRRHCATLWQAPCSVSDLPGTPFLPSTRFHYTLSRSVRPLHRPSYAGLLSSHIFGSTGNKEGYQGCGASARLRNQMLHPRRAVRRRPVLG